MKRSPAQSTRTGVSMGCDLSSCFASRLLIAELGYVPGAGAKHRASVRWGRPTVRSRPRFHGAVLTAGGGLDATVEIVATGRHNRRSCIAGHAPSPCRSGPLQCECSRASVFGEPEAVSRRGSVRSDCRWRLLVLCDASISCRAGRSPVTERLGGAARSHPRVHVRNGRGLREEQFVGRV
jgi:hypothetical protein